MPFYRYHRPWGEFSNNLVVDEASWKKLLERQARERSELEQRLNETRPERAREAARQEARAPTPRPTWALKPTEDSLYPKHLQRLEASDRQELARLGQKHEAEQAQAKGPVQDFNAEARNSPAKSFNSQARRERLAHEAEERGPPTHDNDRKRGR